MDLCGEHGFESIAYSTDRGRDCPACAEIEELKDSHADAIKELESEIENLKDELEEVRSESA